jgi:outer membrane protein TolC
MWSSMVALVCALSAASPAEQLTLDKALELGRKNNRDLKAAEDRLVQWSTGVDQAWAPLLPFATTQGKYTHNYKEVTLDIGATYRPFLPIASAIASADPNLVGQRLVSAGQQLEQGLNAIINAPAPVIQKLDQLDGVLAVTVPLVVPSAYASLSAAKRSQESAEASYEATTASTLLAIAQSFYAAAGTDELIRAREDGIRVATETLDNAQARFSTGVVNRVEVSRAEIALLRAKQSLVESLDLQSQAYRSLATLLDHHSDFHVSAPEEPPPVAPATKDIVQTALLQRPEVLSLEKSIDAYDAQERAAIWKWSPSLSAFGNARAFNYAGFSGDKFAWAFGAQLDWTIYDGGVRDAQRRLAQSNIAESETRLSLLRDTITDEIMNSRRVVDTKKQALETAKRSVDLSSETLELVRAQHEAGTATQLDLLAAQDSLIAAEVAAVQARFDLALASLSFERAAGLFPKKE